ncbi:thiol:disulfide interchange protein DsbA/DsbL [uncultured Thiodictyon sp.]|uniref:thiol:disulfide interchange protein DsbA/DsbL n=1 Tax=uncultured Thiodictyon sp. TaxID=1846217 RepID=UPI0025ECF2AC|nr:thiol:disulfide interchange protein DsbA/DsbL [uncultured Thiodictyon sp.]
MFPSLRVPFLVGIVAALSLSIGAAWAADEDLGYATLSPPVATATGDQVEVVEVFSYSCPHCWHLEPMMNSWVGTKPAGVAFRRQPGTGGRWEPYARAYYAAESLGKLDEFHTALFRALQVDRKPILKEEDLVKFAGEIGIDPQEFRAAYNSFTVETKVRKATDLNARYGIDGVPTVIVNGKYRTSPAQAQGAAKMFEVLNTLVAQELAAKTPAAVPAEAPNAAPAAVAPK